MTDRPAAWGIIKQDSPLDDNNDDGASTTTTTTTAATSQRKAAAAAYSGWCARARILVALKRVEVRNERIPRSN
jgi:hypothetical protein